MGSGTDVEFDKQVRDALVHLYDHAYLQRHPLATQLAPLAVAVGTRGQELRRVLLDAIEALNPGPSVPIRARERRPYAILFGLYVEGYRPSEVASSLGIGLRQLRRERAAAIEALVIMLRDRFLPQAPVPGAVREPLRLESERVAQEREPVDLHALAEGVVALLAELARERGVEVCSHVGPDLPQPHVNRTLMRQILIGLASQALTTLPLAKLSFEARPAKAAVGVGLALEYRPGELPSADAGLAEHSTMVEALTDALGATVVHKALSAHHEELWLLVPVQDDTLVLVVDDNRELFALFERYVTGQPYRLLHATGASEAQARLRSLTPQIITLDLMLPGRDGWELLQALRSKPATARIPIIVCSVLEEPELALSLGAQAYLKKPVGQADLLQALEAVRHQGSVGARRQGVPEDSSALR